MAAVRRYSLAQGQVWLLLLFNRAIERVTGWTLDDIAGFKPPQPLGEGQAVYFHHFSFYG